MGTDQTREEGHVVAVAGRGPVGAVVDAILTLNEAERELGGNIPAGIQGMCPGVITGSADEGGVDALALTEGMADEHHGFLIEGKVVDARTGRLHAKVVLILDVDAAVLVLGNLYVIRCSLEAGVAVLVFDDGSVAVHDRVHVSRGGMVVVGVHGRAQDDILQLAVLLVYVADGVGGAGEDHSVHVDVVVVLVVDALLAVGEDLHLADAGVLLERHAVDELIEHLADALAGILPRDAGGDVAVGIAALAGSLPGVFAVGDEGDLSLDQRTEDGGEGPELVDEERGGVVGGEDDVPPLVGAADGLEERIQRDDREGIHKSEALVGVVHRGGVVPSPRGPLEGEEVGGALGEVHDGVVFGKVLLEDLAEGAIVHAGIGRPQGALVSRHLGVEEPRQGLVDGLHAEGIEEAGVVLVEQRRPGGHADAGLDDAVAVDGGVGPVGGEVPLERPGVAADLFPRLEEGHLEAFPGQGPGGAAAGDAAADDGDGVLPLVAVLVHADVEGLGAGRQARDGNGHGPGQHPPQGREDPPDEAYDRAEGHPDGEGRGHDDDLLPRLAQDGHALVDVRLGGAQLAGAEGVGLRQPADGHWGQPPGGLVRLAVDGVVAEEVVEVEPRGRQEQVAPAGMVVGELGHVVHDAVVGHEEAAVGRLGEAVVLPDVVQVHDGEVGHDVRIEGHADLLPRARVAAVGLFRRGRRVMRVILSSSDTEQTGQLGPQIRHEICPPVLPVGRRSDGPPLGQDQAAGGPGRQREGQADGEGLALGRGPYGGHREGVAGAEAGGRRRG